MTEHADGSARCRTWLWALLPLLLATALSTPLLDVDAFNGDEPNVLHNAGLLHADTWTLTDTWERIFRRVPEQAYGWSTLQFIWVRLVGWSEPAVRALALLAGLLTLAMVYRAGRDLCSQRAGFMAALLLAASSFLHVYMAHARAFTLVALCTTLGIWSTWRMVLRPGPVGRVASAGMVAAAAGLLYLHYFSVLFLAALGLFHLLFVRRRWWQPLLPVTAAGLLALFQLPGFVTGLERTIANEALHDRALATPELLATVVRFMTNGLVALSPPLTGALPFLLIAGLAIVVVLLWRAPSGTRALGLIAFTAAALLAAGVFINEAARIIVDNRVRYLMPLWPMVALLTGAGLARLARAQPLPVAVLLAFWLVHGSWLTLATDFRYQTGYFPRSDFHHVYRVIQQRVPATDLLLIDSAVVPLDRDRIYARQLTVPWDNLRRYEEEPYESVRASHASHPHVWLLYLSRNRMGFTDLPQELGRRFCARELDEWGMTLDRYAMPDDDTCPGEPLRLSFERGVHMTAPEISLHAARLRLGTHFLSEDAALLANYSLAVQILEPGSDLRVAQGDTGIGPGAIVPFRSEIDLSALPPGDYEVRVALYDGQTGARLDATDLVTGAGGDMHTLHRFRIH